MDKLLITYVAELNGEEYIRFDIWDDGENRTATEFCLSNRWAALKVNRLDQMVPYKCHEVDKNMIIGSLCSVIDLLKNYLERIQKEN